MVFVLYKNYSINSHLNESLRTALLYSELEDKVCEMFFEKNGSDQSKFFKDLTSYFGCVS